MEFRCFLLISEQRDIFASYSTDRLVCITEVESVYCPGHTEPLHIEQMCIVFSCESVVSHRDWNCVGSIHWTYITSLPPQKTGPVIHSFSILSDDRSKASFKMMPPYSAMQSLLLQMRISSPVLMVIQ